MRTVCGLGLLNQTTARGHEEYAIHDTDNFPIAIGEYVSIEELNEMYEMIEELPDYIVECLDEFISHYGTLEEVVEHKDDIYYYPDCETMTDVTKEEIEQRNADKILRPYPSDKVCD